MFPPDVVAALRALPKPSWCAVIARMHWYYLRPGTQPWPVSLLGTTRMTREDWHKLRLHVRKLRINVEARKLRASKERDLLRRREYMRTYMRARRAKQRSA